MMGWLKQVLGLEAPKPYGHMTRPLDEPALPCGVALGCHVSLSTRLQCVFEGETDLIVPDDDKVMAIGTLDAGQGSRLIRCYLDNEDYFIQFVMKGPRAIDIEAILLFGYHEVTTLTSQVKRLRLMGPGSKIGMPYYELEGIEYVRQWGTEDGQTEMIALTEKIINAEGSYIVNHDCMLYARDLGLSNRREFLLFSAETDAQANLSLSTAVGVTLQPSDLSILQ